MTTDITGSLLVPPVPALRVGPRSDGGDALWIDPERAQGVIDKLRDAALRLLDLRDIARDLRVFPPAADEVSRNVAKQANLMADNARAFNDAWRRQLEDAAIRLEEQLAAYRATEEHNRARLS